MNNQERATSSSAINNLVDAQKPHHLEMVKNQKDINCKHEWKFMSAPVELGFAQKCLHCGEVKLVENSEQLDELVAWLNYQVEEFEQLSQKESDKQKQAYYQHCASNKQQLIEQVKRHKALTVEKEKERVLQLQVEIKQLTRSFFVGVGAQLDWQASPDRLKEIIGQKLYKSLGYNTAAVYCPQELGITDRQARYLMAAAEVYHNLENRNTTSDFPMPTSSGQCRALARLPEPERAGFLREVASNNNGKIPSVRKLERIIKSRKKPMETPVKYQVTNQEQPKYPIEIKYKAGQPIEYSLKFKDPKSYALLVEYFESTGAATPDGLIQRVLTEALSQLRKL